MLRSWVWMRCVRRWWGPRIGCGLVSGRRSRWRRGGRCCTTVRRSGPGPVGGRGGSGSGGGGGRGAAGGGRVGGERVKRVGGHGTPEVAEFACAELGMLMGIGFIAANTLLRD